ncbi:MAG TPA: hypothetical protein VMA98_11715 [Candidatus Acidoferrales bacterium]|nr:hypothetical protein [Candidatus Acidoferrales bacterium]
MVELDRHSVGEDDAFEIFSELSEFADEQTQRYLAGESGPLTAASLAETFSRLCAQRFDGPSLRLTQSITEDVSRVLNSQVELQQHFDAMIQRQRTSKQPRYADPSIQDACEELLDKVPTFHVTSEVYDQCERSAWDIVDLYSRLFPAKTFAIAVDGETWLPITGDPTQQAQTDWLLVDARTPLWRYYERTRLRGIDVPNRVQVVGVIHNSETGQSRSVESSNIQVPIAGAYEGWAMDSIQAGRLARVMITFLLLRQHKDVLVTPGSSPLHWNVALPKGRTVDQIVSEVLNQQQEQNYG